jgi:adenylate cyclase
MSELAVALEDIPRCFQGVIPSWVSTCSADGVPNVTVLSIVLHVDEERVALTRQYFNKTSANLQANPQAQVIVVDPQTFDQFLLDLRFLHTETEGATFDAAKANLDAIASQTGMEGVFRLRGLDVYRVLGCTSIREIVGAPPTRREDQRTIRALDEYVRRLGGCVDYADATRVGLGALEDLFGFGHCILLVTDERADRLFAVASNGYGASAAGAEAPIGVGVIGIAAERRRVVCVPNLARSRGMRAAIHGGLRQSDATLAANEIPLPGLPGAQSVAAVPLVVRNVLAGVLYLEGEEMGAFGEGDERLLGILGGHLASALLAFEDDHRESPSPAGGRPGRVGPSSIEAPIEIVYYQSDDSVFVCGEYVIKGVPGRILWKLVNEHVASARTDFTNRELRLDEGLGLPAGNDNLEARLLVLRKRLAAVDCGVGLERVGRGRLELRPSRPLSLSEVQTSGPMRAAHAPEDAGG